MERWEEAQAFLDKIHACRPKSFWGKIDECQRGTGFVLVYLHEAEHEVLSGELARELNVTTARISALIKTMEKNGLIERFHTRSDARNTIVKLTPAGIAQAEQMKKQVLEKIGLILEKVGEEELNEFVRISNKIREALGE